MSESPGRVVSLMSILVDVVIRVPGLPPRGGDVIGESVRREVGAGFNLASAVARQGVSCVYAAPHGTGPHGHLVRTALHVEGIATAMAASTEADTGFCIALSEPDLETTYVTVPGVESRQSRDALSRLDIRPHDLVALSGYDLTYPVSGPAMESWLRTRPPGRFVLDPGPLILDIPASRWDVLLPQLGLLTLNQREARLICNNQSLSGSDLIRAVRSGFGVPGSTLIVVREGAAGCVATGGDLGDEFVQVPVPTVRAVDTIGAGDVHTGVLLARLAQAGHVGAALQAANRAAAISVASLGAATAPHDHGAN